MKIIGIDPGSTRAGYGIIDFTKEKESEPLYIDAGIIKIYSKNINQRLLELYNSFENILNKYNPEISGIEKIYFVKNITNGISVSQARGVLILSLQKRNIPIYEFTPSQIKQGITGNGSADKKSIEKMVKQIIKMPKNLKQFDDAYDALAIALMAGYYYTNPMYNNNN